MPAGRQKNGNRPARIDDPPAFSRHALHAALEKASADRNPWALASTTEKPAGAGRIGRRFASAEIDVCRLSARNGDGLGNRHVTGGIPACGGRTVWLEAITDCPAICAAPCQMIGRRRNACPDTRRCDASIQRSAQARLPGRREDRAQRRLDPEFAGQGAQGEQSRHVAHLPTRPGLGFAIKVRDQPGRRQDRRP